MIPVCVFETRRHVPTNRSVSRVGSVCATVIGATRSTTANTTAPRLLKLVITLSFARPADRDRSNVLQIADIWSDHPATRQQYSIESSLGVGYVTRASRAGIFLP